MTPATMCSQRPTCGWLKPIAPPPATTLVRISETTIASTNAVVIAPRTVVNGCIVKPPSTAFLGVLFGVLGVRVEQSGPKKRLKNRRAIPIIQRWFHRHDSPRRPAAAHRFSLHQRLHARCAKGLYRLRTHHRGDRRLVASRR